MGRDPDGVEARNGQYFIARDRVWEDDHRTWLGPACRGRSGSISKTSPEALRVARSIWQRPVEGDLNLIFTSRWVGSCRAVHPIGWTAGAAGYSSCRLPRGRSTAGAAGSLFQGVSCWSAYLNLSDHNHRFGGN